MSHEQKVKVVGSRTSTTWLLIIIPVALVAVLGVGGLIVYPQLQAQQEAEARAAEVEQHYQAGIAFQNLEDWAAAESEFKQVIILDADYKDAQARLAEMKSKLGDTDATATAVAIALEAQAQGDAQATAAIAQATAEAAPTATAEALEARYQRALGLINLEQWVEGQAELQAIFDIDPNYKDVQALLARANAEVMKLIPTATNMPESPPTPSYTPTPKSFIQIVSADVQWIETEIMVSEGMLMTIHASGIVDTYIKDNHTNNPNGQLTEPCDDKCTFPSGYFGQLIGKIGRSGLVFAVNEDISFVAQTEGNLYLAVNDCCNWKDNSGSFTVNIVLQ